MTAQTKEVPNTSSTDRIEKRVLLRAPQSRVWRAIATAQQFAEWFGIEFDGAFAEGTTVRGKLTHPSVAHVTLDILIERIDPERYFSYRWHPYAIDPATDYRSEPTTLVEFVLEEAGGGTALTIVESGFDRIPLTRRAEAYRMNDNGWSSEIKNLERYVS